MSKHVLHIYTIRHFLPAISRATLAMLFLFPMSAGADALYRDEFGDVIRLANEINTPFLFAGRTVSETGNVEKFRASVSRFPTVQTCLVDTEVSKSEPDLSQIAWEQMHSTEDATVCISRIASSYSNMAATQAWLSFHGFENFFEIHRENGFRLGPSILLTANRNREDGRARLIPPSIVQRVLNFDHGESISLEYSDGNNLIHAQFSINTK